MRPSAKKVSRYNGSIISLPLLPMLANPQSRLSLLAAVLVASVSLGACSGVTDRTRGMLYAVTPYKV